ncbi:MAG: HEAT repeat [Glomeribacter sp. 1016415]|nr:HEAT repeat [Glomeribacter sp. 1016415]
MLTPINDMLSRSRPVAPGQLPVQTPQQMLQQAEQYIVEADEYKKSGQVEEAEKLYQATQKLFEEEAEKLSLEPQSGKIIESIYLSYGLLLNEQGRSIEVKTLEQKRQQLFERYRLNNAGFSKKRTVERGSSSLHLNKRNPPVALEQLAGVDASLLSYPNAKLEALQDSSVKAQTFPFKPILTDSAGTDYVGVETLVQSCHGTINAPVHGKNNTVNVHYYSPNSEARQLQAVSLDSLRNALYKHYQLSNLSIQRVSGDKMSLADCYINLAIVESQAQREKDKKELEKQAATFERLPSSERQQLEATNPNKLIALEKLFDSQKLRDGSEGIPKRILIQGRAGIGKTTLCKKLVYEYHENGLWQGRFESLLWIPLRQLKTHSPKRLEDLLCNQYFVGHESRQAQALSKVFHAHQDKTLFILDGLDEVIGELDERSPLRELVQHLLTQAHVVITSRPAGVETSLLGQLDLELETVGFSPDNVQAYIEKFVPESNQAAIQQFINRTPLIQGLVNIPIQLDALCYSWDRLPKDPETITMSMLYEAMVDKLWRKDGVRLEKQDKGKTVASNVIQTSSKAKLEKLMESEIHYLGYLAFKGLEEGKIEFNAEELDQYQAELEDKFPGKEFSFSFTDDLKKTSFLHTADIRRPEAERHYHFLHLTFQEFFAAKFLAGHLQAYTKAERAPIYVVQKDLGVMPQRNELEAFIATYKYNPRYEIVWWMVAGLLKGAVLENFFHVLEQSPRDLIGMRHQQVMSGCLNEARTQLKATTIAQLEKELMQWLEFEIKIGQSYSRLGRQRIFPEYLLLKSLSQIEGKKKERVVETLVARPALSGVTVQALISCLKDENQNVRDAAARALGRQNPLSGEAVQALISSLKDGDENVRDAAARALGGQRTLSGEAVQTLISYLKGDNEIVRDAAARALGGQRMLSGEAVQALISSLKDDDENVRSAAASTLGDQSTLSGESVQALISSLKDDDENVRSAAASALGDQSTLSGEAVQALISSLKDDDENVRDAAAMALGGQSMLSGEAVQALISYLKNDSGDVRSAAANALGGQSMLSGEAVQALISCLKDDDENVRSAAALVLGDQTPPSGEAVQALTSYLKDENRSVRFAAARALGGQSTLSSDAVQVLISYLKDDSGDVRFAAARVLGDQRTLSGEAVQALISYLKDDDQNVRSAAAWALSGQSTLSGEAIQALISYLKDDDQNVRSAAARALRGQSTLSGEAVQALISSLKDDDENVRSAAASALGGQSTLSSDAVQALISSLKDENRGVRSAAAMVLGSQSALSSDAVQALISYLRDENRGVRSAAARALGSHMNQLFTLLARLDRIQVAVLYMHVLFPRSCEQIAPLYIQDKQLHFYTATGPGQPIHLSAEQSQMINKAFKTVQTKAGILSRLEEEPV